MRYAAHQPPSTCRPRAERPTLRRPPNNGWLIATWLDECGTNWHTHNFRQVFTPSIKHKTHTKTKHSPHARDNYIWNATQFAGATKMAIMRSRLAARVCVGAEKYARSSLNHVALRTQRSLRLISERTPHAQHTLVSPKQTRTRTQIREWGAKHAHNINGKHAQAARGEIMYAQRGFLLLLRCTSKGWFIIHVSVGR